MDWRTFCYPSKARNILDGILTFGRSNQWENAPKIL